MHGAARRRRARLGLYLVAAWTLLACGRLPAAASTAAAMDGAALAAPESQLGPLRTRVAFLRGPILPRGASAQLLVSVCHAGQGALAGSVELLATAAWEVRPARRLEFDFAAAPACTVYVLDLALAEDASPGPYDCVLRLSGGGAVLGTLRTQVVKPVEWLVVGPFAAPADAALLPPERGINLEKGELGLHGEVHWQRAPVAAYDDAGNLELDVVFGAPAAPQCACALTVIDLVASERLHWSSTGAERLALDGRVLTPGAPVQLPAGRHTLLARSCTTAGAWRLGVALQRADGTWPRQLDNELARLLPGIDAIVSASDDAGHRHVTLALRAPAARAVQVLGTFNAWVPWELERDDAGTWRRDLVLAPGRYAYKLRVDGRLHLDPAAPRREPDGFGGSNSILIVP